MAEPIRETPYDDRCICVGVWDKIGSVKRCVGKREGPDAPFCGLCEDRHPNRAPIRWITTFDLTPEDIRWITTFDLTPEEAARCVDDEPESWGLLPAPDSFIEINAEGMDALIINGDAAIPPGFTDVTSLVIKGGGGSGTAG